MRKKTKPITTKNLLLKIASLFFGFCFWYLFMQQHVHTVIAPICFHDLPEDVIIDAPENVEIVLRSKNLTFHEHDHENIAVHIDGQSLNKGNNSIALTEQHLFLAEHVSLLSSTPSTILVYIHEKQTEHKKT